MAETAAARKNPRMQIRTLTARTSALALPLLEAQYREHHTEMGGARLCTRCTQSGGTLSAPLRKK